MIKSFPSSGEYRFDGFCYPDDKKEMAVDSIVSLAKADGQRKWKCNVKVVDFLWSEVCKCWVVVIIVEFPTGVSKLQRW